MRKVSLVLVAMAVLAISGGVALADTLWYPYFLVDAGAANYSTDIWISNVSATNTVFDVNLYDFDYNALGTNPATTITITPNATYALNLNGLIDATTYNLYPGGFVKAVFEFAEVSNFVAASVSTWGAITAMGTGAGYIFFPTWLP